MVFISGTKPVVSCPIIWLRIVWYRSTPALYRMSNFACHTQMPFIVMNFGLQRMPYSTSSKRTKTGKGSPLYLITVVGITQYHHAA